MGERCKLPHWGLGLCPRSFSSFALLSFRRIRISHTFFSVPNRNMNSGRNLRMRTRIFYFINLNEKLKRNNVPAETPKAYYRLAVYLPFLDSLLQQLNMRFGDLSRQAARGLRLIPSNTTWTIYLLKIPLNRNYLFGHVCGEAKLISPVHWQKPSQTEEHAH